MAFFEPGYADLYTVMARTPAAREIWARVANQVFEREGDYEEAVAIANIAARDFTLSETRDENPSKQQLSDEFGARSISSGLQSCDAMRFCFNPPDFGSR